MTMAYDGVVMSLSETDKAEFRIDFYEIKPRDMSVFGVEAKFTFKKLDDIKKWLGASDSDWNWGMRHAKQSRAKSPNFRVRSTLGNERTEVEVHPNELYYLSTDYKIHYICQHIFDSFPQPAKNAIYTYRGPETIGILHTLRDQEIPFTCLDISIGFRGLTQEQIDANYHDSFSEWLISRHPIL